MARKLKSLERFSSLCEEFGGDHGKLLAALGKEYEIGADMNAIEAFRKILMTIADDVEKEIGEKDGD